MIALTVNGKRRELEAPMSLISYLQSLGVSLKFIAVAYNGTVLRREEFSSVILGDGDVLEIVRPVGGG
ncbi:MAG: sulfur carrier protein ThiS [Chloroflexi bacterium]|nr:sulfur carrier protein ThiS [Chloroflexota bacterium]